MILPRIIKLAATNGVGAIIVPTILQQHIYQSFKQFPMDDTDCISKGVMSLGLLLDHSLALHPNVSKTPARVTVGIIHHNLYLIACPV